MWRVSEAGSAHRVPAARWVISQGCEAYGSPTAAVVNVSHNIVSDSAVFPGLPPASCHLAQWKCTMHLLVPYGNLLQDDHRLVLHAQHQLRNDCDCRGCCSCCYLTHFITCSNMFLARKRIKWSVLTTTKSVYVHTIADINLVMG
jgi:hypothetical protein